MIINFTVCAVDLRTRVVNEEIGAEAMFVSANFCYCSVQLHIDILSQSKVV